jgi:hypothetical protein
MEQSQDLVCTERRAALAIDRHERLNEEHISSRATEDGTCGLWLR